MWISLSNAFFSIVAPEPGTVAKAAPADYLIVRARRKGDIERVFGVPGSATPHRDYAFRALVSREDVCRTLTDVVLGISYSNFKDSVRDPKLHAAYSSVWGVMLRVQDHRPWSGRPVGRTASLWDQQPDEWPFDDDAPVVPEPKKRGRRKAS